MLFLIISTKLTIVLLANTRNIAKPEHETAARNTVVHAVNRVAIVYNPLAYYRLMY